MTLVWRYLPLESETNTSVRLVDNQYTQSDLVKLLYRIVKDIYAPVSREFLKLIKLLENFFLSVAVIMPFCSEIQDVHVGLLS